MATGGVPNLTTVSNKERTNYARLCRALIDIGTQLLRECLSRHISPTDIKNKVIRCPSLKLIPPFIVNVNNAYTEGYSMFDITLLYTLIKNLCPAILPTRGWIKNLIPAVNEITEGDDVERIHLKRNNMYAHLPNSCVSDALFSRHWADLEKIMVRYDAKYQTTYVNQMSFIANQCMDDVTEKMYLDQIRQLYEQDKDLRREIKKVSGDVAKHKSIITSMDAAVTSRFEKVEGEIEAVKTYTEGHIKDLATEFDARYHLSGSILNYTVKK
ncbi:hypothetical protein KUTeg_000516 [Tegillarca granosa]|uniref:DZIP3-like HEPN domain-containing protein n=1 Tax=Tegillarca granosa TaxID=220873 RepID=A0ABQ9G0J0_TEGGR|nr:hypothetical protein KUTeg_000516 [Tegillarca granosa]